MSEILHVAVGIIMGADGRILIARRPMNVHQGGLWEFPGGKLEPGETVLAALHRELKEELGIVIDPSHCFPFRKIAHHYGDRDVLLDIWRVNRFLGEACGLEDQPLAWCFPAQLNPNKFPAANREIIRLLQLPPLLAITAECGNRDGFRQVIAGLLDRGIRLIQFRQPELPQIDARHWIDDALQLCQQVGARLMLNTSLELFANSPAHGLHVSASSLMNLPRRPVPSDLLFSAFCHNPEELSRAEQLGVDFALVASAKPTVSRPGAEIPDWERFRGLISQHSVPVYAQGGLTESDLAHARSAGAHGIAAISAFPM